jgi:drug/metabolite transporter (DMT)-like permease
MGFLLAVLAAVSNAGSNVLQRAASRRVAPQLSLTPALFRELARQPLWLAGIGTIIASFLLQASALDAGALAAVQPVIVMELPITLVVAARVFDAPIRRADWAAVALMTAGVAALIAFLDPHPVARLQVPAPRWGLASAATAGLVAALFVAGWRTSSGRRAALWGAAAGVDFGFTAGFMKAMTHALGHGVGAVLSAWPTWAMVAAGITGMYLVQNAFHAGPLVAAQPGMTVLDPFTAIAWGAIVFGEPTNRGAALVGAAVGALALTAGAALLSRSPVVATPEPPTPVRPGAAVAPPAVVARSPEGAHR